MVNPDFIGKLGGTPGSNIILIGLSLLSFNYHRASCKKFLALVSFFGWLVSLFSFVRGFLDNRWSRYIQVEYSWYWSLLWELSYSSRCVNAAYFDSVTLVLIRHLLS